MPDPFARFATATSPRTDSPWVGDTFVPDLDRLESLVSTVAGGPGVWAQQTGGGLGLALDLYAADELRRSGYEPDAVWPRASDPRVLPAAVARAIRGLSKANRESEAARRIIDAVGSATSVVHGEYFPKQIDVLVADWDRGPELMVSTKSMTGSYGNNMKNRWEEFVGDVRNMRGRFPLATMGVLFLADQSIIGDNQFARLIDMLRKLRLTSSAGDAFDATCLVIAEATGAGEAKLRLDEVPEDLAPAQFFDAMLTTVFTRLPVSERLAARQLRTAGAPPTAEATPPAGPTGPPPTED